MYDSPIVKSYSISWQEREESEENLWILPNYMNDVKD